MRRKTYRDMSNDETLFFTEIFWFVQSNDF